MNKDLPEYMRPIEEKVEKLHSLFRDPQPGMSTWLGFLVQNMVDLYVELYKAGVGEHAVERIAKIDEIEKLKKRLEELQK
jgi:hypothetical protein